MSCAKKLLLTFGLITAGLATYIVVDLRSDPTCCERDIASVPVAYESLTGCEKQKDLWGRIESSAYKELPELCKFGVSQLAAMATQEVSKKETRYSDFAPEGWTKYLHRRGAVAKVKIVPRGGKYTGVFEGAECGLLRLSLTYAVTKSRPVAPGLALKILRNEGPSANVSALVSLQGQDKDFNFFRHPMSNIVPIGKGFGQSMVHRIFKRATKYPEELLVRDLAAVGATGVRASPVRAPRQLFFVPSPSLSYAKEEHDVREDFLKIPSGTAIYRIYAVAPEFAGFDYANYDADDAVKFLKDADYIADIITTSEFVASKFGDEGIFFRHELRP